MRAYVFWHHARPGADLRAYERALAAFHETLAASGAEGFVESRAHRIEGAPWLPAGDGYEDWYLVESSAALDPLDHAAVAARTRGVHDDVARMAGGGAGGLYRLKRPGEPTGEDSTCVWVHKPAGSSHDTFLAALDALPAAASVWQRQMVLGPAPEFCLILPGEAAATPMPAAWEEVRVRRRRVWP